MNYVTDDILRQPAGQTDFIVHPRVKTVGEIEQATALGGDHVQEKTVVEKTEQASALDGDRNPLL